jgi:hypothetical protein
MAKAKSRIDSGDDLNEVYRQTLAAELLRDPGQPGAEEVIEDIFSGGDGWTAYKEGIAKERTVNPLHAEDNTSDNEGKLAGLQPNKRSWPDLSSYATGAGSGQSSLTGRKLFGDPTHHAIARLDQSYSGTPSWQHGPNHLGGLLRRNSSRSSFGKNDDPFRTGGLRSRGSFARSTDGYGDADGPWGQTPEVNEFDVREDLKCWTASNL